MNEEPDLTPEQRIEAMKELATHMQDLVALTGQQNAYIENLMASHDELIDAVLKGIELRAAQRAYFAHRTRENLIASKIAESEFDKMAKAIKEKLDAAKAAVAQAAQAEDAPEPVSDLFGAA